MRNFHIVSVIAVIFLFGCDGGKTSSESQMKLSSKDGTYQLRSFILPIDWTKKPIVGMSLEIPKSFKSVLPFSESVMADTNEYILTEESIDK